MPEYFQEDLVSPKGYKVVMGRPKPTEYAVGLSQDGVIFGNKTGAWTYNTRGPRLMHYDDEVERQRRMLCDTALAQIILDNPKYANPTISEVCQGVQLYWTDLKKRLGGATFEQIATDARHISNPTSFGRLPPAPLSKTDIDQVRGVIDGWMLQFKSGDLPKIMSLFDIFLQIYHSQETGVGTSVEAQRKANLRPEWYDLEASRGRGPRFKEKSVQDAIKPTTMPGLLSPDFTIPIAQPLERCGIDLLTMRTESRKRGTDMFLIQATKLQPAFRTMLEQSNMVFSASASGSTSSLLTSGKTFHPDKLTKPEALKEFLMGCVAYLVGGGMHTCHEVFVTGKLAGMDYLHGKYQTMLPESLTKSQHYAHWETEFWEIVRPDRLSPR